MREGLGGKLERRDRLVRDKSEGTTDKHETTEVIHNRSSLEVKVAKHFVGAPATEQANDVGIDVGAEEGVGAGGTEATGRYIGGQKTK